MLHCNRFYLSSSLYSLIYVHMKIFVVKNLYTQKLDMSHLFLQISLVLSTVPREGFDLSVIMPFSWCVVAVTLPI